MKQRIIKITLILISILLIPLTFIVYQKLTTNEGIEFSDNLKINFRAEVYIKDLITNIDGELIDNIKINTEEVGKNELNIKFKNKYGIKVQRNIAFEVVDITSPTIVVKSPYTSIVGNEFDFEEKIFCADDYDDGITCNIIGEYDLNEIGQYNLEISASDKSGNETKKSFILNVIEEPPKDNNQSNTSTKNTYTDFKDIYNKYKNASTEVGLDISKWQGEVDYAKLKEQGVDFVMLKIGGQTNINGEFKIDPNFYENIEGATKNNIKVGVYFYSYATSVKEAKLQVEWIKEKLGNYKLNMPIAFDWENWSKYTKFHLSFHTLNKIARTFIEEAEKTNNQAVLYSSKYYLENIWYQEDYTTWLAYYNKTFTDYQNYYMWQLCNDGKIDGISGYVDINIRSIKSESKK